MIPVSNVEGRRIGVLGLGRSGFACAQALRAGGAIPVLWDDGEVSRQAAEADGFELADLTRDRAWEDGIDMLVVSPGIPHLYPAPHKAVQQALERGVPLENDVGLFFDTLNERGYEFDNAPRVIAITGSNGKSTTTALIHHILKECGRKTQMGGNIGRGVLDLEDFEEEDIIVLELSSYQIELARHLSPDIAVFLNLSPDHLGRHGGIGGYFAAKRRLFEFGAPERAIIGVDGIEGQYLLDRLRTEGSRGALIPVSTTRKLAKDDWAVVARKGHLAEWRKGRQAGSMDLREAKSLPGQHNHQNAIAAYAACRAIGLAPKEIAAAIMSFPGLAHRMERLTERAGVTYWNDSKATNADATEKALLACDNIRWILGGQAKEGGIDALEPLMGRIKKAYLIGDAAAEFGSKLAGWGIEIAQCQTLENATMQAAKDAVEGDNVLLSPACASWDQFTSFEARGDAFREYVEALG